jgi:hypothetical protein
MGRRGGGTGGECPTLEDGKIFAAYSNDVKVGNNGIGRATQIMSIFGAADWRLDFFSEFLPLLTT